MPIESGCRAGSWINWQLRLELKLSELPLVAMEKRLTNAHEVAGVGTLFRDEAGVPLVHMHMACGRAGDTITGCIRSGVRVWHVMEVILQELVDTTARRVTEQPLGFKLLQP